WLCESLATPAAAQNCRHSEALADVESGSPTAIISAATFLSTTVVIVSLGTLDAQFGPGGYADDEARQRDTGRLDLNVLWILCYGRCYPAALRLRTGSAQSRR